MLLTHSRDVRALSRHAPGPRLAPCSLASLSQAGQGTVEYVGILGLVAVVLAAAVAACAVLAPGVGNAVIGQVRHALCIVTGRECAREVAAAPCVVRTARDERRESVSFGFVRLGAGRVVLRERLSDGTLRLTVLHRGRRGSRRAGARHGTCGSAARRWRWARTRRATIAGLVGAGQVFEVRTAREADAIVRRLRAEGSPAVDAVRRLLRGGDDLPPADAGLAAGRRRGRAGPRAVRRGGVGRRERRRRQRARPADRPSHGGDDVVPAARSEPARVRRRAARRVVRRARRGCAARGDVGSLRARDLAVGARGRARGGRRTGGGRRRGLGRRARDGRPRRGCRCRTLRCAPRCAPGGRRPRRSTPSGRWCWRCATAPGSTSAATRARSRRTRPADRRVRAAAWGWSSRTTARRRGC